MTQHTRAPWRVREYASETDAKRVAECLNDVSRPGRTGVPVVNRNSMSAEAIAAAFRAGRAHRLDEAYFRAHSEHVVLDTSLEPLRSGWDRLVEGRADAVAALVREYCA